MSERSRLKDKEWKDFSFSQIFKIYSSVNKMDKNKLTLKKGKIPYVTRKDTNNGIDLFIADQGDSKNKANVITVGSDTQTVFYQSYPFYTGQSVQILENAQINRYTALFLKLTIKMQLKKFNWGGNGATLSRLKRSRIYLPINSDGNPDYEYMEDYIKTIEKKKLGTYKNHILKHVRELE